MWGGMERFLLGIGLGSGGKFDMGIQLRRRRWGVKVVGEGDVWGCGEGGYFLRQSPFQPIRTSHIHFRHSPLPTSQHDKSNNTYHQLPPTRTPTLQKCE